MLKLLYQWMRPVPVSLLWIILAVFCFPARADQISLARDFTDNLVSKLRTKAAECGELIIGIGPVELIDGRNEFSSSESHMLSEITSGLFNTKSFEGDDIRRAIISSLSNYYPGVGVVDRERLDACLEEIALFRTGDREAFVDPDKIAKLHRMVNIQYLTFPRAQIKYYIQDWDYVEGKKTPRRLRIEMTCETDVVCVETGMTVTYIESMVTYDYKPECYVTIKQITPDVVRSTQVTAGSNNGQPVYSLQQLPGFLVKLEVNCNNFLGRKLRCGIFAVEPDNSPVLSQMEQYTTSAGEVTTGVVLNPAGFVNTTWDNVELWIPYGAFKLLKVFKRSPPMPDMFSFRNSVEFHFEVQVWEILNDITVPEAVAIYADQRSYWVTARY